MYSICSLLRLCYVHNTFMKRISQSLDKIALNCLLCGLIGLLVGMVAIVCGIWVGGAYYATIGMALAAGSLLTAFLSACWVHRDF
jgi:uncharacterized protein YacL